MKLFIYCLLSFLLINWACRKEDPYGTVTGYGIVFKDGKEYDIKSYSKVNLINDTLDDLGFIIFYKDHALGLVSFHQIPLLQGEIKISAAPYDSLTRKYNRMPGYANAHYYSKCDIDCIAGKFIILEDHPDNSFMIEKIKKRNVYHLKFNLVFVRDKNFTAVPLDPVEKRDTIYLTNGELEFVMTGK